MKLQLVKDDSNTIDGFKTISYTDPNKINEINDIVNNSCEYILANTVLDDFEIEESPKIVFALVSKLRIGGNIVLLGHDINVLAKALLNNDIGSNEMSAYLKDKRSISTALNTVTLLRDHGLEIVSVKYNSYLYEIFAKRAVS